MKVPSTEVQNNFGKYLNFACIGEEIIVTRNGKDIARLTPLNNDSEVAEKAAEYAAQGKHWVTYEEFLELTKNSELRYELIDGEVYILASPTYSHQSVIMEISAAFYNWFKGKKCRPLTAPFDVTLFKSSDNINVVQPDIIVICDPEKVDSKGKYRGVPALVVEVLSDSTRRKDMIRKLDLYMQTGVMEYWLVDPAKRQISTYNFTEQDIDDFTIYTNDATIKSALFTGLEIKLEEIFTA